MNRVHCDTCNDDQAIGTMLTLRAWKGGPVQHYCSKPCLIEGQLKKLFYISDPQPIMDLLKRTIEEDRERFKAKFGEGSSSSVS